MRDHTTGGQRRITSPRNGLGVLVVFSLIAAGACGSSGSGAEVIECLGNANCPPGCTCEGADMDLVGRCKNEATQMECGGTCDGRTDCGDGAECLLSMATDSLELYACIASGDPVGPGDGGGTDDVSDAAVSDAAAPGGDGGTGGSGATDPRTIVERCAESTKVYCEKGYECAAAGWGVEGDVFEQLYGQSLQDCQDLGTPCTTEQAYCGDQGLAGTYVPENHEACIEGQRSSSCEVDEFGLPLFPAECDQICAE